MGLPVRYLISSLSITVCRRGGGLEVLAHIQASDLNSDVATIMITGKGDMETAVTAMRNGCHDSLTKEAMTAEQ